MTTDDKEWFEEKEASQPTVQALDQFVKALIEQREVCRGKKEELSVENEKLQELERKMIFTLKELNRTNYKAPDGMCVVKTKRSWKLPATALDRQAFFGWLKERGDFDNLISVNSNTLNSYVGKEFDKSDAEGNSVLFKVPGLTDPTTQEILALTKGK